MGKEGSVYDPSLQPRHCVSKANGEKLKYDTMLFLLPQVAIL